MPSTITSTAAALCRQYTAAEIEAFAADDALDVATARGRSTRRPAADKAAADRRLDAIGKAVIETPAASIVDVLAKAEIAAANLNVENDDPSFGDRVLLSLIADLKRLAAG